jgi:hypothetical protein
MLRTNRALLAVFALLAIATATTLHADDRYERKIAKTMTWRGGRISVDHSFGNITLRTHEGSGVTFNATIRANDSDFGSKIQVITSETANGISIRTEYPSGHHEWTDGNGSYSVDFNLTIPAAAPAAVRNRFGNVDVAGLRTASEFVNGMGSLRAVD